MAISYTATGSLTSSFSQIKAGFAAAKLNPGQCFVAGTLVLTEDGLIPIEEVEGGMLVWASDPETGGVFPSLFSSILNIPSGTPTHRAQYF